MVEHSWTFPRREAETVTDFPPETERGELETLHCLDYDRARANRQMVSRHERSIGYNHLLTDDAYLSPTGHVDKEILEILERSERGDASVDKFNNWYSFCFVIPVDMLAQPQA